MKKILTERIRENHSTWIKRYSKAVSINEGVILAVSLCVCLIAGSIKEMYAGAKKEALLPDLTINYNQTNEFGDKSAIYTGVLAGAVPFAIANFVMLHNAIYTKKYR